MFDDQADVVYCHLLLPIVHRNDAVNVVDHDYAVMTHLSILIRNKRSLIMATLLQIRV